MGEELPPFVSVVAKYLFDMAGVAFQHACEALAVGNHLAVARIKASADIY